MQYTENFNLKKPEANDFYNVGDFNDNMDSVDLALSEISKSMDISNQDLLDVIAQGKNGAFWGTNVLNSPSDMSQNGGIYVIFGHGETYSTGKTGYTGFIHLGNTYDLYNGVFYYNSKTDTHHIVWKKIALTNAIDRLVTERAVPMDIGGTGATSAEQARINLGIKSVAVEDVVPVTKGGTGETVRYNSITIQDADNSPWNIEYSACRYYPYLRLVYLDITGTIPTDESLNKGYEFPMCKITDPNYIPSGRRALTISMTGADDASVYVTSDGTIRMSTKTSIAGGRIISISGFYRL